MTNPTGLDYLAAYQALYPQAYQDGKRIQDLADHTLKILDRAARLVVSTRQQTTLAVLTEAFVVVDGLVDEYGIPSPAVAAGITGDFHGWASTRAGQHIPIPEPKEKP